MVVVGAGSQQGVGECEYVFIGDPASKEESLCDTRGCSWCVLRLAPSKEHARCLPAG